MNFLTTAKEMHKQAFTEIQTNEKRERERESEQLW
jgi:hypothetical protein